MMRPACGKQTNVLSVLTSKKAADVVGHYVWIGVGDQMGGPPLTSASRRPKWRPDAVDQGAGGILVAEIGAECGGCVAEVVSSVTSSWARSEDWYWRGWRRG